MRRPGDVPCVKRALQMPAEHFRECGPFCTSTRFCGKCSEVGLCAAHRLNPDSAIFWVDRPGEALRKGRRLSRKRRRVAP